MQWLRCRCQRIRIRHYEEDMDPGWNFSAGFSIYGKEETMENNEILLTSVEQFKEYLNEHCDDNTIVSIVMEPVGEEAEEVG